ncbi:MAG: biotin--[acetyl-CoA-carboxylase] ligase [Anaerolineae bacterium]|nr:biotin--[acetyl-CoA-carboxylase] ligase [Anaerolineae bacterium]
MLSQETLQEILRPRPVRYFASTESTNTEAIKWLAELPLIASGAVVVADEQTAGRGRYDRKWLTPPGSAIAMSMILRTKRPAQNVTILGAVAVSQVLEALLPGRVGIKWPNDVMIEGKKVCGILAEAVWHHEKMTAVVLGIGINLSVDFSGVMLPYTPTNLNEHLDTPVQRPQLIKNIAATIDQWMEEPTEALHQAWKTRLVTLRQQVTMERGVTGEAVDVDKDGALLVKTSDGKIERFLAGDVNSAAPQTNG